MGPLHVRCRDTGLAQTLKEHWTTEVMLERVQLIEATEQTLLRLASVHAGRCGPSVEPRLDDASRAEARQSSDGDEHLRGDLIRGHGGLRYRRPSPLQKSLEGCVWKLF